MDLQREVDVRSRAFAWLAEQVDQRGEVLSRDVLEDGFLYRDERVPLLGPRGIFKPRILSLPISIATIEGSAYDDGFVGDGVFRYSYRGTDPSHGDNAGLRAAMRLKVPLIYAFRIVPGRYLVVWPVFVVADDPRKLSFTVQFDDQGLLDRALSAVLSGSSIAEEPELRRAYITTSVRRRLHQQSFRERVLRAYGERCALCRLRHQELLDAAHIDPDAEAEGDPVVPNGLSLCKLHHAAFDRYFLTVRPDYFVEVQQRVLDESDGPMLLHGLKELHRTRILLPAARPLRPDPERLERRYAAFLRAS